MSASYLHDIDFDILNHIFVELFKKSQDKLTIDCKIQKSQKSILKIFHCIDELQSVTCLLRNVLSE